MLVLNRTHLKRLYERILHRLQSITSIFKLEVFELESRGMFFNKMSRKVYCLKMFATKRSISWVPNE